MFELYLSTDGKHTVHVSFDKIDNQEQIDKAYEVAKKLYAKISEDLPTKANQGKKQVIADFTCPKCESLMDYKEGVSQKTNKPWKAYFCQNKQCGHVKWLK